jgi:DNA (cytosine-5)-methyltransferase 1
MKKKQKTTNRRKTPLNGEPLKYSVLKSKLKINIDKDIDSDISYLTHYLQNPSNGVSKYFKSKAKKYYSGQQVLANIFKEEEAPIYSLIHWDIPFPPKENPKFTFIDLFAGIGGIRLAFHRLGGKCVFTSEWNKYAKKTYEANFGEVPFGDITKIKETEIPNHDVLLAGFPCQPFSIAGVSKKNALGRKHGFLDETQGTLFFDIARILKEKRPKAFLLENVKNLVSHDKGRTFEVIKNALKELNYSIHYKVLDAKYFVPQHRERIIIVGFDREKFGDTQNFQFPDLSNAHYKIKDILEENPDSKYTLSNHLWEYLQEYARKHKEKGNGFGFGLVDLNGITRTMSARYYKDGAEILIPQLGKNPRRLTPREAAKLQGFPQNFEIPVSDTQAYRQFGNSVTVPLIEAVGEQLLKELLKANGKHINNRNRISAAV